MSALSASMKRDAQITGDDLADVAENAAYRFGLTQAERAEFVRVIAERLNDHANQLDRELVN